METISVIIPNYNSEKYIERCLNSLVNQEYKLNEIIVVDDCSTDKSKEIIEEYEKKYDNIILHKNHKNMGVSYSRNKGIELATSEYIMFCDSDDWYEKDATKKMIQPIIEQNADYVVAGHYIAKSDNDKIEIKYNNIFQDKNIDKETCISYMTISSCAKIMKKEIFINNNLKYPEDIKNCEELPLIPVAAFFSKRPVYIDECVYNYFQNQNSASNVTKKDLSFYDKTYSEFCKRIPKDYENAITQRMVEHLLYSKNFDLIRNKYSNKDILNNINFCKSQLKKQNIHIDFSKFPFRKKIFLNCALLKIIFPLKLYVKLQEKILGN